MASPQQRAQAAGARGDQQRAQRLVSGGESAPPQREHADPGAILSRVVSVDLTGRLSNPARYEAWRQRREAFLRLANTGKPFSDTESRALRKSRKRVSKRLADSASPDAALISGHRRYRQLGGRAGFGAWARRAAG